MEKVFLYIKWNLSLQIQKVEVNYISITYKMSILNIDNKYVILLED